MVATVGSSSRCSAGGDYHLGRGAAGDEVIGLTWRTRAAQAGNRAPRSGDHFFSHFDHPLAALLTLFLGTV